MLAMIPAAVVAMAMMTAGKVQLRDARVAPTEAGGSVAISALVSNPTSSTLMLTGASTPLAGQTVLQRYMKDADGLMQIKPMDSLPLPPQSETILAPGAIELQLVGVSQDLEAGLELPLTLKFADGTQRVYRLKVEGN